MVYQWIRISSEGCISPFKPIESVSRESQAGLILEDSHSVFTTFRWPLTPVGLLAHLHRLQQNARTLEFGLETDLNRLVINLTALMTQASPLTKKNWGPVIRLTVMDSLKTETQAQMLVSSRPLPDIPVLGSRLKTVVFEKLFPTVKYGRLAKAFSLRDEVQTQGFDDALWQNTQGLVTESTTANVWGVSQGTLYTPDPEANGCLPGITREQIIKQAKGLNIPVVIASVSLEQLKALDACFLSNAVMGVQKVTVLDSHLFAWSSSSRQVYQCLQEKLCQEGI